MASQYSVHSCAAAVLMRAGVASEGSAASPHRRRLAGPQATLRDLADAVHALCEVHGTHPGFLDMVGASESAAGAADWLAAAAAAFTEERMALAQLTAAVGPIPSTPGQAETALALAGQRHAFAMLARSERRGCALGAAAALVLDWAMVRPILDAAAARTGVTLPPPALPDEGEAAVMLAAVSSSPAVERALRFGTDQAMAQHRGLWSLLEARASARLD